MLPFGNRIHARRRDNTGFEAEGAYLGPEPNVSGGHLVLITEGEDTKALRTSTIFPLRRQPGSELRKPEYRLTSKRSPDFAIRVAATVPLSVRASKGTRLTPGGGVLWVWFFF